MTDVTVIGNISGTTLRFTQDGTPVLNFSLAENHRKKQGSEWVDDGTTWRKVSVWDQKAETLAEHLTKGDRVIVVGAERIREFETRDGGKGTSLELTAKHVGIIPKAGRQEPAGQDAYPAQGWGQSQSDPWADARPQPANPPF